MDAPLKAIVLHGVKVYNCTAGKTAPEFLVEARKQHKSLRYNQEYRDRLGFIQDFNFPTASSCVAFTPDNQYIVAAGVYPPQIRIFDTHELSMKCSRHLDAAVVRFLCLSDDYSKLALLLDDRTLEFHARFGRYYRTRIPKFGRALAYHSSSCDLVVGGSSSDVYRLNLQQGRFLTPFASARSGVNDLAFNPCHEMLALAGEDGVLEFWDPRAQQSAVSTLSVAASLAGSHARMSAQLKGEGLTAVRFAEDGLTFAVGTERGRVLLYDLRRAAPRVVKDHRNSLPIVGVHFHPHDHGKVVSADRRGVRIWDRRTGKPFTAVEPPCAINAVALPTGGSGLIVCAAEQHRVQAFFVPALGAAPRWCAFLDHLTEELEESKASTALYDDYKFVTRDQLVDWGLEVLIGSKLLRAYMHGFFMDTRLYDRVHAVADPNALERYRARQVANRIEAKRGDRIALRKPRVKVNKSYQRQLLQRSQGQKVASATLLTDSRFQALFERDEYTIDQESDEYIRLHPERGGSTRRQPADEEEEEEDEQ